MKEQEELATLVNEKEKFLKDNQSVFDKIQSYDIKISELELKVSDKLIKAIPELVSSLTSDNVNFLYSLGYDTINDEVLAYLVNEVEIEDEEYKEYRENELELAKSLKDWGITIDDNGHYAVNDGDYFEVELTLTSPEGISYSVSDETCLAVCPNFPDDLYWHASM